MKNHSLISKNHSFVFLLRAVCLVLQCRAAGGCAQVLLQAKHTRAGAKPGAGSQVLLDLHPHFMGWKLYLLIFNRCSDLKEVQRYESRLSMNYCTAFLGTQAWSCFSLAGTKTHTKGAVGHWNLTNSNRKWTAEIHQWRRWMIIVPVLSSTVEALFLKPFNSRCESCHPICPASVLCRQ